MQSHLDALDVGGEDIIAVVFAAETVDLHVEVICQRHHAVAVAVEAAAEGARREGATLSESTLRTIRERVYGLHGG